MKSQIFINGLVQGGENSSKMSQINANPVQKGNSLPTPPPSTLKVTTWLFCVRFGLSQLPF